MFFVPALPPPTHTFLPGFEKIKKTCPKQKWGVRTPHPPPPPRGYATANSTSLLTSLPSVLDHPRNFRPKSFS